MKEKPRREVVTLNCTHEYSVVSYYDFNGTKILRVFELTYTDGFYFWLVTTTSSQQETEVEWK